MTLTDSLIKEQIEKLGLNSSRVKSIDIGVCGTLKVADVKFGEETIPHRFVISEKSLFRLEDFLSLELKAMSTFGGTLEHFVKPIIDVIDFIPETMVLKAKLRSVNFGKPNDKTPAYLIDEDTFIPDYLKRVVDYTNPFLKKNISTTYIAYLISLLSTKNLGTDSPNFARALVDNLELILHTSKRHIGFLVDEVDITELINVNQYTRRNPKGKAIFEGKRVYSNLYGTLLGPEGSLDIGKLEPNGRFEFDYNRIFEMKVIVGR